MYFYVFSMCRTHVCLLSQSMLNAYLFVASVTSTECLGLALAGEEPNHHSIQRFRDFLRAFARVTIWQSDSKCCEMDAMNSWRNRFHGNPTQNVAKWTQWIHEGTGFMATRFKILQNGRNEFMKEPVSRAQLEPVCNLKVEKPGAGEFTKRNFGAILKVPTKRCSISSARHGFRCAWRTPHPKVSF